MADTATIVNVGDQQWFVARTYGSYQIPAKPKDARCATLEIEGRTDRADIGDKRFSEFYFSGRKIAEDLVADLAEHGVFVAAGELPTEAELDAAEERLREFYKRMVFEADQEWARSHNYRVISDIHRRAAFSLGIEKEWAYSPQALVDCPACGEKIKPGVAVCSHCSSILDREKARQFGLVEEIPEPAGAPSKQPKARAAS